MPTNTYDVIQSYTFSSASGSITLNTLPTSYTHLKLICAIPAVGSSAGRTGLRFNGDSAANYHYLQAGSTNTSTSSDTADGVAYALTGYNAGSNGMQVIDIHGYRSTAFNKSIYSHMGDTYPERGWMVSTWNNTAAITTIEVFCLAGTFPAGTNITIYGIVS
jgi:hypothetical protein